MKMRIDKEDITWILLAITIGLMVSARCSHAEVKHQTIDVYLNIRVIPEENEANEHFLKAEDL